MKLNVNKARFISWMLSDNSDCLFLIRADLLASLKTEGIYTITVEEILDKAGYIPGELLIPPEEGEINPSEHEIILIDPDDDHGYL